MGMEPTVALILIVGEIQKAPRIHIAALYCILLTLLSK